MAVAFGTISSTAYANRTNTTVTAPSGISDGDLLIAQLFQGNGSAPGAPTAPSGWTQIGTYQTGSDSGGFFYRASIWYKIASGESGDYTWTHATNNSQGTVARYTGVSASSPINVSSSNNADNPGTTTRTATGVTTTVANCMLCYIGWDWGNAGTETPPTGMTERLDNVLSYWADVIQASAGASGNKTNTSNSGTNEPRGAFLVALAPPSTNPILTASGGSYSISGATVALKVGKQVSALGGSYSISGASASLLATRKVAANAGSYSISGAAASLLHSIIAAHGGGSYLISGSAINLYKGRTLVAINSSYSISGSSVSLLNKKTVVASGGSYATIGAIATLLDKQILAAAGGSYSISGAAVSLERGLKVAALSSSYLINGADVSFVTANKRLNADPGTYTINGSGVTLNYINGSLKAAWLQQIRRRRT